MFRNLLKSITFIEMHLKLKLNLKISVKFSVFWNLPENLCSMFFRDFKLIFSFSHAKLLRDFLINCTRTFSFQALTVSPLIFFKISIWTRCKFLRKWKLYKKFLFVVNIQDDSAICLKTFNIVLISRISTWNILTKNWFQILLFLGKFQSMK